MAKTPTKSSGSRARRAVPAKSAAKPRPARPVAKSAVKAPPKPAPKAVAKPKPAPAKPAPKAAAKPALTKASLATKAALAKKPVTKSSGAKLPPLKALPKKSAPVKAPAAKSRPAAVDASPASEAEIIGAVTGKLSRPGAGGFSWLNKSKEEAAARATTPEIVPVAAPVVAEVPPVSVVPEPVVVDTPAPEEAPAANAPLVIEDVPPPAVEEEAMVVTVVEPEPSVPEEEPAELTASEPVVTEEAPEEQKIEMASLPPPIAAHQETPPAGISSEEALTEAFKAAAGQLGWALALQGIVLGAFCALVKGGVPLSGLPHFLAGAIPLLGMLLVGGAFISFGATQAVLDRLESGRPDLTSHRKLAHRPAQIILGLLILAWFFIGITVWFL